MTTITARRWALVPITLLAVLVMMTTSLLAAAAHDRQTRSNAFWETTYLRAVMAEHYDSLVVMAKAADAVIVGRIVAVSESRSWVALPELGDDGVAFYAKATVEIEEVLRGRPAFSGPGTVDLELFLPNWKTYPQLAKSIPEERAVFFLRQKDDTKTPMYGVVTTDQGYLRDFGQTEIPVGAEDSWLLSLEQLPFDSVVDSLRSM